MSLKTVYRVTMTDEREVNLNLIYLQGILDTDVETVADTFTKSGKGRTMQNLPPISFLTALEKD